MIPRLEILAANAHTLIMKDMEICYSYSTAVCIRTKSGQVFLDSNFYKTSATTKRHIVRFLNMKKWDEIEKRIMSKEYNLADLQKLKDAK